MTNGKRLELLKVITMFCCMLWFSFRSPTSAAMLSNQADRPALMAFKDSITQDPSGVLTSWNDSLHFCRWNGVSCGDKHQERVTRLDLLSKNLTGTLSPFIGNLSFLRVLNLAGNFLQGEIPPHINRLFRLQVLTMNNNSFEGIIPTNISSLSNLRVLRLGYNNLHGRIPEISYLWKLEHLGLAANNLVGDIPPSLGNMSFLTNLNLGFNELEGSIPRELGQLVKLTTFVIQANKLKGIIPRQLYNLSSLVTISMGNNYLEGSMPWDIGLTLPNLQWLGLFDNELWGSIPVSLLNCSRLNYMALEDNQISGTVPPDLGRLQYLYRLIIGNNRLGSKDGGNDLRFLSSLVNCSNLEIMAAGGNFLKGSLPKSIANFSSRLQIFSIGANQIYGEIPSGIGNLVSLNYFAIQWNDITGSIPDTVGKLRNLQEIYMDSNTLSGRIPPSFGNLTLLNNLILGSNNFDGSLPPSLGKCQRLLQLDISYCNLTSNIPSQLFELSSQITTLLLNHNALSGPLPLQVGNLKNLVDLDISDNKLSSGIPEMLGGCLSLVHLYIQRNLFEGTIPQSLSALRGLEVFDVSSNNLTGRIPQFLAKFPFLSNLNLSSNDFEGIVPHEGVFRNASGITVDGNSKLCGGIPALRLPTCLGLSSKKEGKTSSLTLKAIIVAIVGVMAFVALFSFTVICCKKRLRRKKPSSTSSFDHRLLKISYQELSIATNNFSEDSLIGVGSFSSVYKGILDYEKRTVAVKVLNLEQKGGSKSFMSECEALRNIRHRNLLRILTSCSAVDFRGNAFKALVFEFMPNGTLERWLYPNDIHEKSERRNLNLVQRLNVAIDVASALEYLHYDCGSRIVHGDLKPGNILLDGEMIAHVGDFGLAKVLTSVSDHSGECGTSSLVIKGTIGYVPPEYGMSGEVTIAGDVYSYGILLLEMFIAKKPTNEMFKEGVSLHNYAKMSLPGKAIEIIDLRLTREDIDPLMQECLISIMRVGVACSIENPLERMHINDVVKKLSLIKDNYQNGDATSRL